ncbi:MAG: hypothetical protein ACI9ON_003654 [Limisphaerales bacterium]|jgi:hypothetical protein
MRWQVLSSMRWIIGAIATGCLVTPFAFAEVDLSGTYDVATLTPLQRPAHFGANLFLTPAQAEVLAAADRDREEADSAQSNPDREAPPEGGDGSAGASGNVGGYNTFWIDNGDQAFTVDGQFRTSIITYPTDGRQPAMTATGNAKVAERRKRRRPNSGTAWWLAEDGPGPYDNPEMRPLAERCLLGFGPVAGPPMLPALYNNVKRIIQTDETIMIMAEMVHDARVVRMNAEHRPASVRTWLGDSIGWWDGDTLVVETTNFKAQPALYNASHELKVTERFNRIDSKTLGYAFTVEDPAIWSEAWRGDYPWPATAEKLFEYACHEGNYALGNIMRGARILEQDIEGPAAAGQD